MRQKIRRLRLEVVGAKVYRTTTSISMPEELPSVEEALKDLVAAMNALKTLGLSKTEVMRLRTLIQTSSLYQKRIAEYIDYRGLEKRLIDLNEKYEKLSKREQDRTAQEPGNAGADAAEKVGKG